MPAYVVTLLIGLMAGAAIGYLVARLKSASSVADRALLDDYKSQLEAERSKRKYGI